jgi:type VI secretion system protein ImpA
MAVAKWLRQQDAYNPAAFMMVRGLRWGELLAGGESPDQTLLVAPPGELRQELKKLSLESNWADVIEKGEEAASLPCGRGWLDLHRYTVRACESLGYYDNTIRAIKAGLRMLLGQLPALIDWTLMDDTPTANPETRTWLQSEVLQDGGSSSAAASIVAYTPPIPIHHAVSAEGGAPAGPDVFQMAMDAARAGRKKDAVEILARQAATETTGRGRFQRKVEVAQVCLQTGFEDMAHSILEELAAEIDRRKLEEWEKPEMVSHPLALLYRTMSRRDGSAEMRQKLYAMLCRLDPLQALSVSK